MNTEDMEPHALEAMERAQKWAESKDAEMGVQLDAMLLRMTKNFKAVPQEDVDRWEWEHCIVRDMLALGWDRRHCKRIAPNWNCPKQERAFDSLSSTLQGKGAIVALVGTRGIGKTTLAAEHSRLRVEARRNHFNTPAGERPRNHPPANPGRYEKLGRLSNIFKPLYADFGSINSDQLAGQLERWCQCDLVVLDELHETEDLKTNMRFLVDFVDRRYANHKDTILISNHDPEQFRAEVNPSIVSRIGHHGGIMHCNWESHRK